MKFRINVLLMLMYITSAALADNTAGTAGFQFLRTHIGARPAALAGAFAAVAGDVNSIYYNPAGIAPIKTRRGSATYLKHLLDFNSGFVGYVHPGIGPGNLGMGIIYMDYGDFKKRDIYGSEIGNFGANSIALSGVYAMQPVKNLSAGLAFKYIRASIDNYSADAVALDAGIIYNLPVQQLSVGAGIYNVGQATSAFIETKDALPLNVRIGIAKKLEHLPLLLNFNVYKYSDETWHGSLGGEFTLTENVFFRLGYDTVGKDIKIGTSKDKFAGAAIGFGVVWRTFSIDYAFSTLGEIGSLNRFTISSQF